VKFVELLAVGDENHLVAHLQLFFILRQAVFAVSIETSYAATGGEFEFAEGLEIVVCRFE
jgi:hypothetical protein